MVLGVDCAETLSVCPPEPEINKNVKRKDIIEAEICKERQNLIVLKSELLMNL